MKRPFQSLLFLSLPFLGLMTAGCQRSMNGSMANGPFAPAGTASPAGGSQLFPMGPITGATRVPPPATGSSSASNAYTGAPSASNFAAPSTLQASNGSTSSGPPGNVGSSGALTNNSISIPDNSFRNSLGGMPVIDLTAQIAPDASNSPAYGGTAIAGSGAPMATPNYATLASSAPVGSGVYSAPYATETSVRPVQPSEMLRPIDQPYSAVPVPRYRGIDSNVNAVADYPAARAVLPAGGFPSTDAWQSVSTQPVPAASYSSGPTVGVTRTGPSTEPVQANSQPPAAQVASPSLPWRSPTTAR